MMSLDMAAETQYTYSNCLIEATRASKRIFMKNQTKLALLVTI